MKEDSTVEKYLEYQSGEFNINKLRKEHDEMVKMLAEEYPKLNKDEINRYLSMYSGLEHLEYREREKLLITHSKKANLRAKYKVASHMANMAIANNSRIAIALEEFIKNAMKLLTDSKGKDIEAFHMIEKASITLARVLDPAKIASLANIIDKQIEVQKDAPEFHLNLIKLHEPLQIKKKKFISLGNKK